MKKISRPLQPRLSLYSDACWENESRTSVSAQGFHVLGPVSGLPDSSRVTNAAFERFVRRDNRGERQWPFTARRTSYNNTAPAPDGPKKEEIYFVLRAAEHLSERPGRLRVP